jgi:uncharacterized membrane-anchored protein YhcB (DUF1043 family)
MIVDVIQVIDRQIGSISPADSRQTQLAALRQNLDDNRRQLSAQIFDENNAVFQNAAQQLQTINTQIQNSATSLQSLGTILANINQFVSAVASLVGSVAPLLARV